MIEEICLEYSEATGHHWYVSRESPNDNEQILVGRADPNAAPRIDIIITCWKGLGGARTKFPFENKRINDSDTKRIKFYIKNGLIDRYLNQKKDYAAGQPWGGMIGYILHTTIVDQLNEQIDKQLKRPTEHLHIDRSIEGFESIYKSQHQYLNGTDIRMITHLFFPFLLTAEPVDEEE